MMKKSTRILLSLSLAAVLGAGATACSPSQPASTATPSGGASSTSTPVPTSTSSQNPSVVPTPSESASTGSSRKELDEAVKAFPNLKVNDGENQNDVALAVYGASRYVNTVYNSGYLANGSWDKNGASAEELSKIYGKDWSDSYRAKLAGIIDDYHSSDSDTHNAAVKTLMNNILFLESSQAQGASVKVPDDCSQNNVGAASCLVRGVTMLDKDITYQVNKKTGSIIVSIAFTDNLRIVNNGVEGISAIHYNIQLEMIKNPYPDEQNLRFTYIVNDVAGGWNLDNWHKGA